MARKQARGTAKKQAKTKQSKFLTLSNTMAKSAERVRTHPGTPAGHCDYCGIDYEAELVRPVQAGPFTQKMACKMCSAAYHVVWIR